MATRRVNRPPVTATEHKRMRELHAQGKTLGQIAVALGRAKKTISQHCAKLGLDFDRTRTRAAAEAKRADGKLRRAELAAKLLDDAERLRSQIWQPHVYIDHGGRDFVRQEWTQPEPTSADKLKLMQATATALDRSLKLDEYDAGDSGTIGSLLGSLFTGLQAKHGTGDDA